MPFSSDKYDTVVKEIIDLIKPKTCLDIGAGAGKYGILLRGFDETVRTVAVEIEPDYIEKYMLNDNYDEVRCINASELLEVAIEETFDLIIFGDSLEHLRKSEGVDLVNFWIYRCRYILLIYPERFLQNSVDGYRREAHISVWNETDFAAFNHSFILKRENQRLVVLQGYLCPDDAFTCINNYLEGLPIENI